MRTLTILALITAALSFGTGDAKAERYWPWCAYYNAYTYNCGFATFQQCLATISGVGGFCRANPYPPPVIETRPRGKRARHTRRH